MITERILISIGLFFHDSLSEPNHICGHLCEWNGTGTRWNGTGTRWNGPGTTWNGPGTTWNGMEQGPDGMEWGHDIEETLTIRVPPSSSLSYISLIVRTFSSRASSDQTESVPLCLCRTLMATSLLVCISSVSTF